MRPVNLIPPDDRRGKSAPSRAGQLPNFLIGGLALLLVGVTMVVLTGNKIADSEAEIASLERQQSEIEARAQTLASFVSVEQVRLAREQTLTSLADSRFDWERVMQELALVLPGKIQLDSLRGTVAPEVQVDGDPVPLRGSIPGPALELVGCGPSHTDVARLIAALEDIDGVTRVAAETAERPKEAQAADGTGCDVGPYVTFGIVAGFDAVPIPVADGTLPPATTTPSAPAPNQIAATEPDGGVAAAEETRAGQQQDLTTSEGRVARAKELIP